MKTDRNLLVRDLLVLLALSGCFLAVPHYASEFLVSMALTCAANDSGFDLNRKKPSFDLAAR